MSKQKILGCCSYRYKNSTIALINFWLWDFTTFKIISLNYIKWITKLIAKSKNNYCFSNCFISISFLSLWNLSILTNNFFIIIRNNSLLRKRISCIFKSNWLYYSFNGSTKCRNLHKISYEYFN